MKLTPAALSAVVRGDLANALSAISLGGMCERKTGDTQKTSVLPISVSDGASFEDLEKEWGLRIVEAFDSLLMKIVLPNGWRISPCEHSPYWSDLLERNGTKRASVFYKSASYDRRAHMSIVKRYSLRTEYIDKMERLFIYDAKIDSEIVQFGYHYYTDKTTAKALIKNAEAWLDFYFPDYKNPFAYWKE